MGLIRTFPSAFAHLLIAITIVRSAMAAALWKQSITSTAWREALAAYDENLGRWQQTYSQNFAFSPRVLCYSVWKFTSAAQTFVSCSGKNSQGQTLVKLDQWHSSLASTLKARVAWAYRRPRISTLVLTYCIDRAHMYLYRAKDSTIFTFRFLVIIRNIDHWDYDHIFS